jgi:hypothetical protein
MNHRRRHQIRCVIAISGITLVVINACVRVWLNDEQFVVTNARIAIVLRMIELINIVCTLVVGLYIYRQRNESKFFEFAGILCSLAGVVQALWLYLLI